MSRIRHQHLKATEPESATFWDTLARGEREYDAMTQRAQAAIEPVMVRFLGATYDPTQDEARLATALQRIRRALETGRAFTLKELAAIGQCSEAGASARVRDIRRPKEKGGCGLAVQSERVRGGLWHYRIVGG